MLHGVYGYLSCDDVESLVLSGLHTEQYRAYDAKEKDEDEQGHPIHAFLVWCCITLLEVSKACHVDDLELILVFECQQKIGRTRFVTRSPVLRFDKARH